MTEEQIDILAIQSTRAIWKGVKWFFFQLAVLCLLPFVWPLLGPGAVICIGLYTVLYNVYWLCIETEKRADYLWIPYVIYLLLIILFSIAWGSAFQSIWVSVLFPVYGALCYIAIRLYRRFRKRYLTTSIRRRSFTTAIVVSLLLIKVGHVYWGCKNHGSFDSEKTEILQRRDYLADKLITPPKVILDEMPAGIGSQFQGEWAIYSCSMYAASLANISRLYPETRETNMAYIDSLIRIVMSPEISQYDANRWGDSALLDLDSETSHLSYVSILAWMASEYRLAGGDERYDDLQSSLCEALNRRILNSPSMNLQTYPGELIYVPDMLVAIVALHKYALQHEGKYQSTVDAWIKRARERWCDKETGLLVSYLSCEGNQIPDAPIKGSYSGLNCSYLTLIDEEFAREQYALLKKYFGKIGIVGGIKEYNDKSPMLAFDIDSGPIVLGLSASGTAFGMGAVTYFNDSELRYGILRTAEIAGHTLYWDGKRHYALANLALVGEAVMLAMRTNVSPNFVH